MPATVQAKVENDTLVNTASTHLMVLATQRPSEAQHRLTSFSQKEVTGLPGHCPTKPKMVVLRYFSWPQRSPRRKKSSGPFFGKFHAFPDKA